MNKSQLLPRIAIKSIGVGLLLMAFFTMMWSGIAEGGFNGSDHYISTVIFSAFSLTFIIYGVYLFVMAKHFPLSTEADKSEVKEIWKWYGIIFGAEGAVIPIVVFSLIAFHYDALIIPGIAMVVGLHFYPMAKLFNRKIDYYLATWTCLIALTGIIMTLRDATQSAVFSFTGIGVAIATSGYGFFMIYSGYQYLSIQKVSIEKAS
jgi:hypothetical protein